MSAEGRWRRIYSGEWHAAAFHSLSDAERVVYFYARTGPQSTSVGIYRMSTAVAVEDLGNIEPVDFDIRFDVVCRALNWHFDPRARVLWMPGWLAENPPQSPNVCVSWRKLLVNLPDCDLKIEAAAAVFEFVKELPRAFREAFGSLPKDIRISKAKPLAKPEANQGTGNREQGSGIRGTRLLADEDEKILRTARQVLTIANRDESMEELVDTFLRLDRQHASTKEQIVRALTYALREREAASSGSGSLQ